MFGTNTIRGQSAFKDAGDRLLVTSMFLTLQGEGPYQGRPAVFVRLAYCNLDCIFCDTFFDQGDWFTIDELVAKTRLIIREKYGSADVCGVVVTGGEPSLQPNIREYLDRMNTYAAFTQVESNGILYALLPIHTTLVISPKCSEKTGKYIRPHERSMNKAHCLKFVVSAEANSPYHTIPDWAFEWKEECEGIIYVSPMNMYRPAALEAARSRIKDRMEHSIEHRSTVDEVVSAWDDTVLDREKNRINHNYAAKYAIDNGLQLTLQMHLFAQIA